MSTRRDEIARARAWKIARGNFVEGAQMNHSEIRQLFIASGTSSVFSILDTYHCLDTVAQCWSWSTWFESCILMIYSARGCRNLYTVSFISKCSLDFSSSNSPRAIRSSASMYSTGLCSCTATLLRWMKIPGFVAKKRSTSSRVLFKRISFFSHEDWVRLKSIPVCSLRIEEVSNRNKGKADNCPNYPELPA